MNHLPHELGVYVISKFIARLFCIHDYREYHNDEKAAYLICPKCTNSYELKTK